MSLFDSIKYPMNSHIQYLNDFHLLPFSIRIQFDMWMIEYHLWPPTPEERLVYLRGLILEYDEDSNKP